MQWIPYRPEDMAFKQWRYNKKMFDFPKLQRILQLTWAKKTTRKINKQPFYLPRRTKNSLIPLQSMGLKIVTLQFNVSIAKI